MTAQTRPCYPRHAVRASLLIAFSAFVFGCENTVPPDPNDTSSVATQSSSTTGGGNGAGTTGSSGGTASSSSGGQGGDLPPGILAPDAWYITPDASSETMLVNAIGNAQSSIRVGMYLLTETTLANALVDAAARPGMTVTVVIDNSDQTASYNATNLGKLTTGGVKVVDAVGVTYHHAKYMVVDSNDAYVMTSNWTYSSFNSNREVLMHLTAPAAVAELVGIFDADAAQQPPSLPSQSDLVVSPFNSRDKIADLVGSAKQTLWIGIEEAGDYTMNGLMADRVSAGVDVRVLLANPSEATGNTHTAAQLTSLGVTVRYLPSPYLHEKIIIADDRVFCGSENLSTTSLDHNREVGLIGNGDFLAAMQTQFQADWQDGVSF